MQMARACYYSEESWGPRGKEAIVGAREDESIIVNYLAHPPFTLSNQTSEKEWVIHLTRKWMPVIGLSSYYYYDHPVISMIKQLLL